MPHRLTHKSLDGSLLRTVFALFLWLVIVAPVALASGESGSQEPIVFSKCWEFPLDPDLRVGIAADDSAAYLLDTENKLRSVDLARGNSIWSTELGGEVVSNLLLSDNSIFLVTSSQPEVAPALSAKTFIRSLSRQTGITEWQTEIAAAPTIWLGFLTDNVVAAGSGGSIAALTGADGKLVWKTDLGSPITSEPSFLKNEIQLGTRNNDIVKISAGDGRVRVAWKAEYLPTAVTADGAGRLFFGDERGNLVLVSADGERVWRFRNGAQISSATIYGSEYLATSYDNFVYKLSRGGDVKWKRRLSGRANERPLVIGDVAVISVAGMGSVYTIDLRSGKISNRIETGEEASLRIAAAPNDKGFVVAALDGLSYFNSTCVAK